MLTTANYYCRQIVEILMNHGVRTAYCSPGSRNTPLLIAVDACRDIKKYVVVDERSAAFQALGCSLIEQNPVILICTSGTALLNYAPAVAEAYYAGVPLIVISADRPREWIDQDDSQTIRQYGALDRIVKGSYDVRAIPEGSLNEYTADVKWTVNRTVNEAFLKALDGKPGPVHINVQLSDPLGELGESDSLSERCVTLLRPAEVLPQDTIKDLANSVARMKVMLVAGFMLPNHKLDRAVRLLAAMPNVVVMAETISNLHDPQPMSSMIDSVLCDMNDEEKERMRPDIVISIGGALVSRMLKQYLRDYPPLRHWIVGHSNYFCDCFKGLTDKIDIAPESFIRQLTGAVKKLRVDVSSGYRAGWEALKQRSATLSEKYIEESEWSDLKALDYIFRNICFDNIFISNGTAVRYSQLLPHSFHAEYCNRGVSGIDGCTSTAVGGARAYNGETLLLSGDMSWLYDSGSSALHDVPIDMKMIVVDNAGGGIFRFVRSTASLPSELLNNYFCVNDLPDVANIAEAYGIETLEVSDMRSLKAGVEWLKETSDLPRLLLVITPPEISARILSSYFVKNKR